MRIAVIGPQNTGKSTFVKDFLKAFPAYRTTQETYRDLVKQRGLQINQKTTEESQRAIRDFLFHQTFDGSEQNILFDRCVIDNYIYTLAQFEKGVIDEEFLKETEEIMCKSLAGLDVLVFIPTAVSVSLVNDLLRDTNTAFVDRVNCLFIETLLEITKRSPIKIVVVAGSREERISQIQKTLAL